MTPWLVRLILALLALEAGVCVAFLADDWKPLREKEDALFERLLTKSREGDEFVIDASEPAPRVRLVRPLVEGTAQPYLHVKIDEKAAEDLHYPLEPEDWWGLLNHMHDVGCRVAAIEEPLTWEGEGIAHLGRLASLNTALSRFETVILTVDLHRPSKGQPIPTYLQACAIPLSNVTGEIGPLVRVNRVLLPPSATPAPNVQFSFRMQESIEEARPEILRWDDYLIPSFPLAVAMAQANVSPDQVHIQLGHHIRLGDGPIIPINEIGELQIELIEDPAHIERLAIEAYSPSQIGDTHEAIKEKTTTIPRCVLFTDASRDNPSPWRKSLHLQKIISSLDVLPRPEGVETHQRLSVMDEVALLGTIAVIAALLLGLPGFFRHLSYFALLIALPSLLVALYLGSQKWTPFAPAVATVLTGWILATRMARYLPGRGPRDPDRNAESAPAPATD